MAFFAIAGCQKTPVATTYHFFDGHDGYSDRSISENSHEIQVTGNTITTHATLVNQFNKRAHELCNGKPFQTEIKNEVSTSLDTKNVTYYYTNSTVRQTPYVTGKVTCSK